MTSSRSHGIIHEHYTVHPEYSAEMHQSTTFYAELIGEHAGEGFLPLRSIVLEILAREQGHTHGGGGRGARPPWNLKNTIFRVSSVKLRDLDFRSLFFEAYCYVVGLRKPAAGR